MGGVPNNQRPRPQCERLRATYGRCATAQRLGSNGWSIAQRTISIEIGKDISYCGLQNNSKFWDDYDFCLHFVSVWC